MHSAEGHDHSHLSRRGLIAGAAVGTAAVVLAPATSALAEPGAAHGHSHSMLDGEVTGFSHTGVFVENLGDTVEFYGNLLGLAPYQGPPPPPAPVPNTYLDLVFDFPTGSGLYLSTYYLVPGGPNYGSTPDWLEFFQVFAPKIGPEQRASIFREGNYMHSFNVNDARGLYRNLMKAGVRCLTPGGPIEIEPNRWLVHVADPSNVVVELVEPGDNTFYRALLH